MNTLTKLKSDRAIWIIVLFISLFSLLVVYSSSNVLAHKFKAGHTELFLIKQFRNILIGFVFMFAIQFINYKYFSRLSQLAFFAIIPLLILTLAMGKSEGGAERWLEFFGISIQTSEIAKLVLIIYVARILTVKQEVLGEFKNVLKFLLAPICLVCIFILPANLSTAAMLFMICFAMMFFGRVKIKILAITAGLGFVALTIFGVAIWNYPDKIPGGRGPTWKARIEHFLHLETQDNFEVDRIKLKEENYQADMAKIAVANGGILGRGPGNSEQRNFLPQANSDFIYAIFIEEYGLIFGCVLIFLYMILFFRGISILKTSDTIFGGLIVLGLSFAIIFQAFINMAVSVGLFPVTGQPLPMVSSGGSSLIATLIALGIILSVSRFSKLEKKNNIETT